MSWRDMMRIFTRVFDGRRLRVLGYQRQLIASNWKLMMENIKDPYHASLLHVFLLSFGLFRVDQKSECLIDDSKGHAAMVSRRAAADDDEGTGEMASYNSDYTLEDPRLSKVIDEIIDTPGGHYTLDLLAQKCLMSRTTFSERFHRAFGRPAMDFGQAP